MGKTRAGEKVNIWDTNQVTAYGDLIQGVDPSGNVKFISVDVDGKVKVDADLNVSDIQIGAVEIKDSLTDDRVKVDSLNRLSISDKTKTGYTSPDSYTLVSGTISSGTIENAKHKDKTYLILDEDPNNGMEIIFNFTLPSAEKPRKVIFCGRYDGGAGHKLDVFMWDYDTSSWKEISTLQNKDIIPTENDTHIEWDIDNPDFVDSNGNVKIRIKHQSASYDSGHSLYIDHFACGDYKSPELLARIKDGLEDLQDITDRGYMKIKIEEGKTTYDLPDPRIKDTDINYVKVYGDIIDDADFKSYNIPIRSVLTSPNTSVADYALQKAYRKRKNRLKPTDWIKDNPTIYENRTYWLINLDDGSLLEMAWVFQPGISSDLTECNWRILPENFTEKDATSIPWNHQTFTTTINNYINTDDYNNIYGRAEYYNDAVYLFIMYHTTNTTLPFEWKLIKCGFDKKGGFSTFKSILLQQNRSVTENYITSFNTGNNVYFTKPETDSNNNFTGMFVFKIDPSSFYGYSSKFYSQMDGYYNKTGVDMCHNWENDNPDDLFYCVVRDYTTIRIYKANFENETFSFYKDIDVNSFNEDIDGVETRDSFFCYSIKDGEFTISFVDDYDGDRDYIYSYDNGVTWNIEKDETWTYKGSEVITTDKIYVLSAGTTYYVSPLDRFKFAECLIDYDDLTITFSKQLVGGSNCYIIGYKDNSVVIDNKITFDEDGVAIIKPMVTEEHINNKKVSTTNPFPVQNYDINGNDVIGEVQLNPTSYTILGRLKSLEDKNPIDPISGLRATTDATHYEIHEGDMWHFVQKTNITVKNTVKYFMVVTGVKSAHATFGLSTDQKAYLEIYKSPVYSSLGTDITSSNVHNKKISVSGSPVTKVYEDPVITSDGIMMMGAFSDKAEIGNRDNEHILDVNSSYLIKVITTKDDQTIYTSSEFYEE